MAIANAYPQVPFSEITDLEEIGRGGFGIVYKANWRAEVIAVKGFFPNDEIEREELENMLTQSFRIAKHPNIIDVYGVTVKNGLTCLLMEYAYGGSLQRVLFGSAKEEYTTKRAISWMYQCAQGVAFLHSKKLLHTDLKPANLLLTDRNCETLKISDFGTIRELEYIMTGNKGSMARTAPEVFGEGKYNEKSDVFSFAIILWEVFTREGYYRRFHNIYAIPDYVLNGSRPKLKDVWPDELKLLMTSCWHENPSKRPFMKDVVLEMGKLLVHHFLNDLVDAIDGAEGNQIIPSSSTSQGFPFNIKMPSKIRIPFPFLRGKAEILVMEQLTSLNSIKKEAFEKGLFGITYKAEWITTLVLKVYNRMNYSNMDNELYSLCANQILGFRQRNVIDLYFMFIHKSKIYYGIDYVEGGSLYKILHFESKRYTKEDALDWLTDLALGLTYFHDEDICVNMLTSRNLFIDRFGKLKIGLPVEEEEANFFKTTYKSAAWTAPEVYEDGKYSKSSDIYSLGIIIWEVMNCKIPFEGCTADEIAEMVTRGARPPLKEDEDESIRKLLRSCWQIHPQSRPTLHSVYSTLTYIKEIHQK